eukprot:5226391-Amphidinium_carterae.1
MAFKEVVAMTVHTIAHGQNSKEANEQTNAGPNSAHSLEPLAGADLFLHSLVVSDCCLRFKGT